MTQQEQLARLLDTLVAAGTPGAAVLTSLGCGNPTTVANVHDGDTAQSNRPASSSDP